MNLKAAFVLFAFLLAVAAVTVQVHTAEAAATRTWTGLGATNNWSDGGNWNTAVPVAGDSIVFPAVALRKTNVNDLAANTAFATIDFTGSGYSVSGNSLQVSSSWSNDPGSGSNLVSLDIGGSGGIEQISGKLTLAGNNTFGDGVDIVGGVLATTSDTGLGGPTDDVVVQDGATLQLAGGVDIGAKELNIEGDGFDDFGALQSIGGTSRADDVGIDGATTIGVSGNSTLIIETLSQQSPGAPLTLVGGGKLLVEGAFFAGPVDVIQGNLTWNASAQAFVTVDRFGWLRGTGTVSSVTVTGGLVWPGSGAAPGVLSVFGPTNFVSGTFKVDLDGPAVGTGYGQLVTNGLALAPVVSLLDLELDFTPAIGQVFRIVDNTSGVAVQGTFRDLPEGAVFGLGGYAFKISYEGGDGNDVTLTVLRQLSADLKLTAEASPSPVAPGGTLVYALTVLNQGPDTASSPTLTMGTPVGTTFDSASGPAGWTCSKPSSSPSVQCTGPSLASGASAAFILRFKVNAGATGNITGAAGVSSQTNDAASANNSVTLNTPIGAGGALPFRRFVAGLAADK